MSIYETGEKDAIKIEAMKLQELGGINFLAGVVNAAEAWLLYNFNVDDASYALTDKVKLPAKLFSEMYEVVNKCSAKVAPMAEQTKPWLTRNRVDGFSKSECPGGLLRKYASDDEFKPMHTNVALYAMTDQASGVSELNRSLRSERFEWVLETWFKAMPQGVEIVSIHHDTTDSARQFYFKRSVFRGQIKPLTTRKGRAQHRSVLILKYPAPAVTVAEQDQIIEKVANTILTDAIDMQKDNMKEGKKGKPGTEVIEGLVLCLLKKTKSKETDGWGYMDFRQVNKYLREARTYSNWQIKNIKGMTQEKVEWLKPGQIPPNWSETKKNKQRTYTRMKSMKVEIYKLMRCSNNIKDFLKRMKKLAVDLRGGWSHINNERNKAGDAATDRPVLELMKWIENTGGKTNHIQNCMQDVSLGPPPGARRPGY